MSLLRKAGVNVEPATWETLTRRPSPGEMPAVTTSADLTRILALPRREATDRSNPVRTRAVVELMTERLARPRAPGECECARRGRACITELKPAQAWALYELGVAGGLLAPIGVGHGKTGLDILAALVVPNCRVAVLLIPPGLRAQLVADYLAWREHFRVPSIVTDDGKGFYVAGAPALHVVPFSRFQRAESTGLLENIRPDTIIIDEAHKAKNPGAATTKRIIRYFVRHPETRLAAWSGTLTAKSIKDYAHLSAFALRMGSPLPLNPSVVADWALALDAPSPHQDPAPAGALEALCAPGETLHAGFNRRLVETRGVVATTESAVGASMTLHERKVEVPFDVETTVRGVRETMTRPDGEEFVEAMAMKACARQVACGFYYRWKFPHGEPVTLIEEWFAARKAWHKELRGKLENSREHLDSPLLCWNAARRFYEGDEEDLRYVACPIDHPAPEFQDDVIECDKCHGRMYVLALTGRKLPTWEAGTWPRWREMRDQVQPEPDVVWLDDFLARDAAAWASKHRGIVWYEHDAFGRRVAELAGLPLHGGGPGAEARIAAETGRRSIIASIKAHGTGRDGLQHKFCEQLVANPPAGGDAWEQLLGRLHRIGQAADSVETWVYRHTLEMRDAIDSAVLKARYIEGTLGTRQKLLAVDCDFFDDIDLD